MLTIYTDLNNTKWLEYLVEEFKRIQDANFDIRISSSPSNNSICINYCKQPISGKGSNIFNCNQIQPTFELTKMSDGSFIIPETKSNNEEFECKTDIFWNAFVFLSRLEEFNEEQKGNLIKSYSTKHPRIDKNSFQIPIVNMLFSQLENFIKQYHPELEFKSGKPKTIELSHDLDYIQKTMQLRLKQTAFNTYNTVKSIAKPKRFIKTATNTIKFLFKTPSYWCFDYWEELEKKHNKRSVFYVYSYSGNKNITSWLIDPSYQISNDNKLIARLKRLIGEGFEIGLHGSYASAFSKSLLEKEKMILEEALGTEVKRTRQHWLNFKEDTTPYLHNELFELDSTLAWNDMMGFRAGCSSMYRPYDHKNDQPFKYMEIPQVIMDSQLYDYGHLEPEEMTKSAINLLENLDQYKNVHVSISWHQRVCSTDYIWHKSYEKLITI
ncbi:MAG TPA: hypothetical protein EYM84_09375 [Flavobacteriales bacterium]|nr:hypothetical protein [Flavobacteriales bacterium]